MNDHLEENGQFRMRLDEEVEETAIPTQVDDLRIEKLSHRVTLISILIPVLIVVILVIAYLDIKKRVIQTEDTGQLTAESLSKDLESRFETVTMTQRMMEENLARMKDQTNQSVAKIQVSIKKLDDRLKSSTQKMVSRSDMKRTADKLDQNLVNMARTIEEIKLQLSQFTESFQTRMSRLDATMTAQKETVVQLEQQVSTLQQNTMDKPAMELAIKLEALKIKQYQKARLDEFVSRLEKLERRSAAPTVAPTTSTTAPKPGPASATPPALPSGKLEEQTLGR